MISEPKARNSSSEKLPLGILGLNMASLDNDPQGQFCSFSYQKPQEFTTVPQASPTTRLLQEELRGPVLGSWEASCPPKKLTDTKSPCPGPVCQKTTCPTSSLAWASHAPLIGGGYFTCLMAPLGSGLGDGGDELIINHRFGGILEPGIPKTLPRADSAAHGARAGQARLLRRPGKFPRYQGLGQKS